MLPQILTVNPMAKSRRRKYRSKNRLHHHKARHHARRASNPHRRHYRHTRRYKNPLGLPAMGGLGHQVVPALIGGAGAIGVDIGLAYAAPYLPAFLQSGWGRIGAQVGAALALGFGASKLIDRETGKAVMAGALTITAYSALRQALAPTLGASVKGLSGLADFSDYTPATNWSGGYAVGSNLSAYMPQGAYMRAPAMGAYYPGRGTSFQPIGRLGYMNPGSFLQKQMGAYMPTSGFGMSGDDM
jgi:hypothetical protein